MNTISKLVALALLLSLSVPGVSEIYRWTDAQGRVHFSDNKPEEAAVERVEVRINTIQSVTVEKGAEPPDSPGVTSVVMYSTTWCGVCKKAKAYFRQRGIAFKEYDVEKSAKGRQDFARLGGRGVPLILVNGSRMSGFSAASFERLYAGR